ncbi:hypothetical protein KCMC57_up14730 [Kitasatospora sp. CMC57]|uniref:Uncharacterized protein n=1 Tax=Kitasatospora sp. CMC57 TaxID=3231513 RepID=A0AB33JXP5_9ACTN
MDGVDVLLADMGELLGGASGEFDLRVGSEQDVSGGLVEGVGGSAVPGAEPARAAGEVGGFDVLNLNS